MKLACAAVIATLVIPISFLIMGTGMNITGTSGNLMSLGALDFGLIVDGSIIIIENCLRRLAERQHHEGRLLSLSERLHEVFEASREMVKPTIYGQAIIFLVFVPLLTFTGVEGKTFSPMAITVLLALAGAALVLEQLRIGGQSARHFGSYQGLHAYSAAANREIDRAKWQAHAWGGRQLYALRLQWQAAGGIGRYAQLRWLACAAGLDGRDLRV